MTDQKHKAPPQVVDANQQVYLLDKRLGEGGQGVVYTVKDQPKRIVKLMRRDKEAFTLRAQFKALRRLDLRELHVAKPISVLQAPHVGYVAEFLEDMSPISALITPPKEADLALWYKETGGLKRRLRLLAHAGEALAGLHEKGLIYMDVSHNNVFVSEPQHALEAWLIDLDNLSYDAGKTFYTQGYGAPEVVSAQEGCTSLSDAWSFAVLVWQTLTLNHPFIGDDVDDGEPELEEQAFRGELPWVEHSSDDSNLCTRNIPADIVITNTLMKLARSTFEEGLKRSTARPSVRAWVTALHSAADQTRLCHECGSSSYVNQPVCPWCDAPWTSPAHQISIKAWDPEHGFVHELERRASLSLTDQPLTLTLRTTRLVSGVRGRAPHVTLQALETGVKVIPQGDQQLWYALRPAHNTPVHQRRIQTKHEPKLIGPEGVILPWDRALILFSDPTQGSDQTIRETRVAELIRGVR